MITLAFNRPKIWAAASALALLFALGTTMTCVAADGPKSSRAAAAQPASRSWEHRVVIHVDTDDERVMGHAISYSLNLARSYAQKNETVKIEIVANGSGIKLFRADVSTLQQPLAILRQAMPDVVFSVCDSSRQIAERKEGHAIALVPGARLVPFGVGRLVELQEAGWSYIHG